MSASHLVALMTLVVMRLGVILRCCADSVALLSVEQLPEAVLARKHFSDGLYDWADVYRAEPMTTEVTQLLR